MKSLNYTLASVMALFLFACNKDKKDDPMPKTSHEMVVVGTHFKTATPGSIFRYHAIITDLQGNVLDFAEIAEGATTVLSTGDPTIQYFDFHIVLNSTGQFSFDNVATYHNITGDTIELGSEDSGPLFTHSKLKVNGITEFPNNIVFDGGVSNAEIFGGGPDYIWGEVRSAVTDAQKIFLSYLMPGEDKYRYYWNKDVPIGADIVIDHASLPQMSALKNIQVQNGITTDYFYVFGKPNEAGEQFQLTKGEPGAVSEIPVFIPANFASDFYTNIVAHDATYQYNAYFNEIPSQYNAPVVDFTVANNPGSGFNLNGTGFDFYNITYYQPADALSWVVSGPKEDNVIFKFPSLPDSIITKIGVSPAQLTEPPSSSTVIDYVPDVSSKYLFPRYNPLPFTRKDEVRKL